MADRKDKNWFYICYYTLIAIGGLVAVYFSIPEPLRHPETYFAWFKWLLPLALFVVGVALTALAVRFTIKRYGHEGATLTRNEAMNLFGNRAIPPWIKVIQIAGTIAILLSVVCLILAYYNVPILPGIGRILNMGMLPWILLLSGSGGLVLLWRLPQTFRRATESKYDKGTEQFDPGLDKFPAWVVILGLISMTATVIGVWMIAARSFE
jgi:hypothetical protein